MKATPLVIRIEGTDLPGPTCGPVTAVRVGLQVRKDNVGLQRGDAKAVSWETEVSALTDARGAITLRGPAIHGRPGEKFLYLVWVGRGPDGTETMFRRAKLQLDGVHADVLGRAVAAARPLVARLGLTDERGGPRCASVRPPVIRWTVGG